MRLVTFVVPHQQQKIGIHTGPMGRGLVIDAAAAARHLKLQALGLRDVAVLLHDMLSVIRHEDESLPLLHSILYAFDQGKIPGSLQYLESSCRFLAPISNPVSMRDGYAFRQHVEAARRNRGMPMIPEFDQFPTFYFTNHLAVTGPGEIPVQPRTMDKLDFELEAAIVVGKGGRNIPAARADDHIFGYMIMNDWSARTLQMEEMKLNLGPAKGKDFATSLGPYLVTRDELTAQAVAGPHGERHNLPMKAYVNEILVSDGNLQDMNWTFGQILERVSYGVTVRPGEVIGSGTVGTGCFLELNGTQKLQGNSNEQWLKAGDTVVLEIEGLGRLENRIVAATEEESAGDPLPDET